MESGLGQQSRSLPHDWVVRGHVSARGPVEEMVNERASTHEASGHVEPRKCQPYDQLMGLVGNEKRLSS